MLFSDRQKFIYCYVMMLYDLNYFVKGKAKINGKMTVKFVFFPEIYVSYVANPAHQIAHEAPISTVYSALKSRPGPGLLIGQFGHVMFSANERPAMPTDRKL